MAGQKQAPRARSISAALQTLAERNVQKNGHSSPNHHDKH
jgi:hypothetical protein